MFNTKTHRTVASIVLATACLAAPLVCRATTALKLSGAITGVVSNATGIPQMGATVLLYNRQDRNLDKVLTDAHAHPRLAHPRRDYEPRAQPPRALCGRVGFRA